MRISWKAAFGACVLCVLLGMASAVTASARCVPISRGEPCLGPIQSEYAFAGVSGGDVTYIHAKPGPEERIGTASDGNPITKRTFTWHSVASVKLVAVYIVTEIGLTGRYRYRRVPTRAHSGHAVLVAPGHINTPQLLLEGSRTASIAVVTNAIAHAASKPTTAFQCEKRYQAQLRRQCLNQLPGASCAHPLIAEKAEQTTRGAHRYFKITFKGERDGEGLSETYTYAPVKNVGICPRGVTYKVSLLAHREHCERRPKGEEYCSIEYDTKNIAEPTTQNGGEFEYILTNQPVKTAHMVIKGYFIHPPWEARG